MLTLVSALNNRKTTNHLHIHFNTPFTIRLRPLHLLTTSKLSQKSPHVYTLPNKFPYLKTVLPPYSCTGALHNHHPARNCTSTSTTFSSSSPPRPLPFHRRHREIKLQSSSDHPRHRISSRHLLQPRFMHGKDCHWWAHWGKCATELLENDPPWIEWVPEP